MARALRINRTTVYYHFEGRDALIRAVRAWSSTKLASAFDLQAPRQERIDYITRFVLQNPELIKLWIEEFLSVGDIRDSYPHWDALVAGIKATFGGKAPHDNVDAEVFCVMLLTSAFIGPRVFRHRIRPGEDTESVVRRFSAEHQRWLKRLALVRP